jgi:hypothetical protein
MTGAVQIEILPERFWRPRIAGTECRAGPERLQGFLMAVHGRHAAITPAAAARVLEAQPGLPGQPRRPWRPWEEMRGLVGKAINAAGDPGERFWSEVSPALLYSRALVPIVHAVSRRIGRSYLFGKAASPAARAAEAGYDDYQASFDDALARFLSEPDGMGTAFWDGVAFSLWSEFLLRAGSGGRQAGPHDPVPDADPGVIHWLRRLKPAFASDAWRRRPTVIHARINPQQPRPKQGGVSGVRMSHSPDDLPDRLVSEAVYPPILQLDRLLHAGYLVRHRPPPLDRRRDILVLGLFPGSRLAAGLSFASAAWLDAALRAAVLLRRANLQRSDFAAVACTAADGAAVARVSIERLGWLDAADPWVAGVDERFAFLRTAGCLPGFLDRGPGLALAPVKGADLVYDRCLPGGMGDWLRRVIADKPFLRAGPGEDRADLLARYSAVHVQLIVPGFGSGEPEVSAAMYRGLLHRVRCDLGLHDRSHAVAAFAVSRHLFGKFSIHTELRSAPAMRDAAADGMPDEGAFAGSLIGGMIDSMVGMPDG